MPIADRVLAVELRAQRVVAGAEFEAGDVGQAHDLAVVAALEHDVAELLDRAQAALGVDQGQEVAVVGIGSAPSWPAETCTFCSRIARTTSPAVRPREATLSGSSQTRIA